MTACREATCGHPEDVKSMDGKTCLSCTGREATRSTTNEGAEVDTEVEPYKVEPHPPLVSQVCQRCGALVGSRAIHDAWHVEAIWADDHCGLPDAG